MADTPNPAPAGAGDAPMRPMNEAEGVERLLAMESDGGKEPSPSAEGEEYTETTETTETEPTEELELAGEGDEGGEAGEDTDEGPEGDASEPEQEQPPAEDDETGSRMHRLRDGTQVSLADLKRGFDRAREIERHIPQVQQRLAQADQREREFAAQQQQLQPVLAQVASILQGQIPAPATDELWQNDPIEASIRDRAHQKAVQQLQQVNQAHAQQQQRAAAEQQQRERAAINGAAQVFFQARPQYLADKAAHEGFVRDFSAVAQAVGFKQEDLGKIMDARLYALGELAIEGMKARQARAQQTQTKTQTAALVAKKVAGKPPVAAPAARQSPGTHQANRVRTAKDALLKNPNSMDAAIAAVMALDSR